MKIYLAGYVQGSVLSKCIEWRRYIRNYYNRIPKYMGKFTFMDPLNGKKLKSITQDGLRSSCPSNSILHRDYKAVEDADLILANMDTFGESRPLTGTICELAWAWDKHKQIVLITDDPIYRDHPFLSYFASWIVKDVDELIKKEVLPFFYKGGISAVY